MDIVWNCFLSLLSALATYEAFLFGLGVFAAVVVAASARRRGIGRVGLVLTAFATNIFSSEDRYPCLPHVSAQLISSLQCEFQ
jgi:ABC-type thiamin/hydroxymethylpyrimidine transport system permease subunit